jgi:hypothetical protein
MMLELGEIALNNRGRSHYAVAICLLLASSARAQDVGTFVTEEAFVRPQYEPGDEAFVRDYAKGMGLEFNADMELPACQWRTRTLSAHGRVEGSTATHRKVAGYLGYIRIPVLAADTKLQGLSLDRSDFPSVAYLELRGDWDSLSPEKAMRWSGRLVLPPLRTAGSDVGPMFNVAKVSLGGINFITPKVDSIPNLPTEIPLSAIDKILATWDGIGRLEAEITTLAPDSDGRRPAVTLKAEWPQLPEDMRSTEKRVRRMDVLHGQGQCKVFGKDCRDGECG